ncbi:hypothetical protein ACPCA8_32005 [Streptomyces capoamus]|uniref:hypothetical protein n=1 Tax=Streptomyces capoamus TaxID=68183 RepID=UPI003C3035C0
MVESGAERVRDGVHTEPYLTAGGTYQLNLVCFGHGSARMRFTPAHGGTEIEVPCDQSVVRRRVTGRERMRIDVDGDRGASGVVAWEIDATD